MKDENWNYEKKEHEENRTREHADSADGSEANGGAGSGALHAKQGEPEMAFLSANPIYLFSSPSTVGKQSYHNRHNQKLNTAPLVVPIAVLNVRKSCVLILVT